MDSENGEAYEALIEFLYQSPIGLVQIANDGIVEMINPMSAQLLMPLSKDGTLDNLFTALESVAPQLRSLVQGSGTSHGVICDALRIHVDEDRQPGGSGQVLAISLLKIGANRLMVVVNDVTTETRREQQGIARRLSDAARQDSLTRMPNRVAIREHIDAVFRRMPADASRSFAVLFMNCDRFRQINETRGHSTGDRTLRMVADRLRSTLRANGQHGRESGGGGGQMAGRVGGDEFVVVLDDLQHPDDVHVVADRLLEVLDRPYSIGQHQLRCRVSIGVVLRAEAVDDADGVLEDASIAMSEAKQAGGARYTIFEPGMRERAARRGNAETDLRRALANDELFVVYQPVVGFNTSGVPDLSAGVEALVRWRHPTRGIVSPLEFIELAEECGMIGAIGRFVLSTACRQFMAWLNDLGPRAPKLLAVNLSRAQMADDGLVTFVRSTLEACAMRPAQLQLEVTETLAAQDASVRERLEQLKGLGLTLALDDFGTGYSSLSSLHQLPVDTVKIDRSFVSHAASSRHHRVLIEATIRVANSLGMQTVAEGIETEAQAAVIRGLGCDKGQGYLFSKPLDAPALVEWLLASEAVAV